MFDQIKVVLTLALTAITGLVAVWFRWDAKKDTNAEAKEKDLENAIKIRRRVDAANNSERLSKHDDAGFRD
jgi:hypothetical protein